MQVIKFKIIFILTVSAQASSNTTAPILSTVPATIITLNPILPNERHISFAVNKENDSAESQHMTLQMNDDEAIMIPDGNSTSGYSERRSMLLDDIQTNC